MRQRSEQRFFSNVIVVMAPASFPFHLNVFQLRVGSSVVFSPVENEPSIKGTIVKIDESTPLIKVERTQSETDSSSSDDDDDGTIDFVGASAFDILPAATVECSICRELRRSDEMNRQPCCPNDLCVHCDAKEDKCAYCRKEKA